MHLKKKIAIEFLYKHLPDPAGSRFRFRFGFWILFGYWILSFHYLVEILDTTWILG